MKRRFGWLPSPAMAVALGALILSVGGNVAAGMLITSADIRDDTIRSADVRDEAIRGVDVHDRSLTGADVNESTLGRVPSAANAHNADLLDGKQGSEFVADGDNAGGDVSGEFSDLQIDSDAVGRDELNLGAVGREELSSGTSRGCCTGSFFEFTVPANACHTRAASFPEADLGEILLPYPESQDLGAGVYMRPTVVGHPGEIVIETCNSTGADIVIPFGTFFRFRLIANNTTGF